jgi:UDP-N-acetylglucosamine 2-epimerase
MGLVCLKLPKVLIGGGFDKVVVLGDRYEILAAACCAYNLGVPIAHIQGGDTTLGSLDNGYRAAIRVLASEHYDVAEYGSLGCVFPAYTGDRNFAGQVVLAYHPHRGDWENELQAIIKALRPYVVLAFGSNKDAGGREVDEILAENKISTIDNLPRDQYIDILRDADFIIGNSSSGVIEAPSLGKPSINVGDRQKGRLRASSVIDCEGNVPAIRDAIKKAAGIDWRTVENPYYKPDTVERIGKGILG